MKDKSYYYYLNGREIKDEDFVIINPDVKEEYDEDGKVIVNLQQYKWKEIDTKPAFYLFSFSNGMYYAGSTKNMLSRLTQHYNDFNTIGITDWHQKAGNLIRERMNALGSTKGFKYAFVCCVKIFVQYTSSLKMAEALEKAWLHNVKEEGQDKFYYNSVFYSKTNIEEKPEQIIDTFKVQKEAEKLFKGRTVVNNIPFIEKEYTEEEKNILEQIDKYIEKMPNTGEILITIPELRWEYICVALDAHKYAKSLLRDLMLPDVDSSIPLIHSARIRNGGVFSLKQLRLYINGNEDFYWFSRNCNQVKYEVRNLPKTSGVYILTFPSGKQYIGSSKNIQRRVGEHLRGLYVNYFSLSSEEALKTNKFPQWYKDCMNELSNKAVSAVKIEYIETQDYREREEIETRKKPINSLYNTQTGV